MRQNKDLEKGRIMTRNIFGNSNEKFPIQRKQTLQQTIKRSIILWECFPAKRNKFGMISLFNGISIFMGYLMPKHSLEKKAGVYTGPLG